MSSMSWGETTARWKRIPCGGLSTCRLLKTWYFDNFWYYIYLYLIHFVAWKIQWLKSQGLLPDLRWCFDAPRTWTFPWASVCIRTCVFFSNVAARASFRPRVSTRIQEMNGDDIYTYIYVLHNFWIEMALDLALDLVPYSEVMFCVCCIICIL